MSNFGRALRLSLHNRFTVVGILVCSSLVALLWGANIGTIYPVVEVAFQGDSTHQWIDGKIEPAKKNAAEFEQRVARRNRWGGKDIHPIWRTWEDWVVQIR